MLFYCFTDIIPVFFVEMFGFNKFFYFISMNEEFLDFGLDYLITGATNGTIRLWAVRKGRKVDAKLICDIGMA